ncbi:hypothetical protein Dimus_026274 [Dionaea muscipula]
MVKTKEPWFSQQHFPQGSPKVDCMVAPFEPNNPGLLPCNSNVCWVPAHVDASGRRFSEFIGRVPTVEDLRLFGQPVPEFQTGFLPPNPPPRVKQFLPPAELDGEPLPFKKDASSFPQQKRYLIFDQSGSETRLIVSSLQSPVHGPISTLRKPMHAYGFPREDYGVQAATNNCLQMPGLLKGTSEDYIVEEISCSHEDTEEINALLCSDDEDLEIDDDDDNDEVSTGHSPLAVKEDYKEKEQQLEEEVASSEFSSKRRKGLDGGRCCELPLMDASNAVVSPLGLWVDENGIDFSSSLGRVFECKQARKDKLHDTLRILQSIVPGAKGKEPLLVIDEAIKYLKYLKFEAKTLYAEDLEN